MAWLLFPAQQQFRFPIGSKKGRAANSESHPFSSKDKVERWKGEKDLSISKTPANQYDSYSHAGSTDTLGRSKASGFATPNLVARTGCLPCIDEASGQQPFQKLHQLREEHWLLVQALNWCPYWTV